MHTRAAVAADGRILSLEAEIREDLGAYCFYPANYLETKFIESTMQRHPEWFADLEGAR